MGIASPCLPGDHVKRVMKHRESFQVAYFQGTGVVLEDPILHAAITASRWGSGMSLRATQNKLRTKSLRAEHAQKQEAGIPHHPTGLPTFCSSPPISLAWDLLIRIPQNPAVTITPTTA